MVCTRHNISVLVFIHLCVQLSCLRKVPRRELYTSFCDLEIRRCLEMLSFSAQRPTSQTDSKRNLSEDLGSMILSGPSPSKDIMVHEGHKMFIRSSEAIFKRFDWIFSWIDIHRLPKRIKLQWSFRRSLTRNVIIKIITAVRAFCVANARTKGDWFLCKSCPSNCI